MVNGNTTFLGFSDLTIADSILNLHTTANLSPWTINDGKDIGIKMHYYDTEDSHAALVRANDTGYLEWYSRGRETTGNIFSGNAYGVIKSGELILANATPTLGANTGALKVYGGASIGGNLYIAENISANTINSPTGNIDDLYSITSNIGDTVANTATIGNLSFANSTITSSGIIVLNANTALQLPVGTMDTRPAGEYGYIRFNTDIPAIEYHDGTRWVPVTNTVSDQVIDYCDGVIDTFTLDRETSDAGVIVSINGTLQQPSTAYTIVGNQITFIETPEATDVIDIRFLGASVAMSNTLSDNLYVSGDLTVTGILSSPQQTKASNAPGEVGQVCWDENYIYVCTAPNTWKRTPLTGGY